MRIGIDVDGVLRDLIGHLTDHVKENHPEYANQILTSTSWDWHEWLPFWTEEEAEKYIFEDNYIDLFGIDVPPIQSSLEDWIPLKRWAEDNGHELVMVSAQRKQTQELTDLWLEKWGFDFKEKHYTHLKHLVDVDVLIDDSPSKLGRFKKQSVNNGQPICFKQTWNKNNQKKGYMPIDRLSDIMTKVFG